jgi:hypothetical protein
MSHPNSPTKFLCLLLIVIGSSLLSALYAGAATINVPADCPTIQAGIDAAQDGDTVLVAPGTYTEYIDFKGKGIMVASSGGPLATTIDGGGKGTPVTIGSCGQNQCALQGFTVKGGSGSGTFWVYVSECSPWIVGNIFTGALSTSDFPGTAVFVMDGSPPLVIERNIFVNSGCIYFYNYGDAYTSSPKITNNLIVNNNCDAIEFHSTVTGAPEISNNTIVGNESAILLDLGLLGPGGQGRPTIKNNIIVGNWQGINLNGETLPDDDFRNNLVYANTVNYSGMPDKTGINGNISADPLFVDPAVNDYHVYTGSPAIGAGDANSIYLPSTDLDGNPRDINGKLDMGVYETDPDKPYTFHTVTASAGAGGTITPNGSFTVTQGESIFFTITPDANYQLIGLLVDGTNVANPSTDSLTYVLDGVNSDHTISAVFARYYDYFAMKEGNSFQYSVKYSNGSTKTENRAVSLDTSSFATPSYMFQDSFSDGSYADVWYQVFPNRLLWNQTCETDGAMETYNPPLPMIKIPLAAGATWTVASTDSESGFSKKAIFTATVYPRELVRVPAGYFLAWPIRYHVTFPLYPWVRDYFEHWFSPCIGYIRSTDSNSTAELASFAVAGGTVTIPPPVVTGTSPASATTGSQVIVNGYQFGASQGSSVVRIGSLDCQAVSWSDQQIQIIVPQTAYPGAVTVVTDTWTSNDSVMLKIPPQISNVTPSSGNRGSTVQIAGTNFGKVKGKVKLGSTQVKVTKWADKSISFTVPTTMPYGTFPVTVINLLGQSVLKGAFTVIR